MAQYKVQRSNTLFNSELRVPGDKSVSHRSMMFAGLSNGTCEIKGFLPSEDCVATLEAMRGMGVTIEADATSDVGFGPTTFQVTGRNGILAPPNKAIDCGNSGTTMRLMTGLLAAQRFDTTLTGDASLTKRPMGRVVTPLSQMKANIETQGEGGCAPLFIRGKALVPIIYEMPVASAQVKSAVLLAGLATEGKTTVAQPITTRDHTELMLRCFNVNILTEGNHISIEGGQTVEARDFLVPGDISSAAFWLVAAAAQDGSRLTIRDVGLNRTRTGIVNVLRRMGATITETSQPQEGEPIGSLEVRGSGLQATEIGGEEIPNIIDELPILAVAGALASGTTIIRDAQELKVKETDRIHAMVTNLRAMGADVEERDDGMIITGGRTLQGAKVHSFGDHRIAMAFAIAGLFADGETIIDNTACVNTSYPGFEATLQDAIAGKLH